jgi:hypothetical protein
MKKILLIFIGIIALVSCEDDLDRAPIDNLTPFNAFQTLDDLEVNLLGMYDAYVTFGELSVNSIATDNTKIGVDNGGQQVQLYNLNIFADGGDQGLYLAYSRLHNRASRVIVNADLVNFDDTDASQVALRNNILGQAYAMRAFAHFKMFEYFTPNYLDPNGLSVPYVDFVAGSSSNPARDTVSDFTVKFNADLAQADLLLANNNGIDRINKSFVTFLRARHALAIGENINAIGFANSIINTSGTSLASGTDYVNMFSDLSNTEVVFKRDYTLADGRIGGVWFFTGTGGYIMEVSTSLRNAIDRTNDPNRYGLIVENASTSAPFGIGKYPGSNGANYLNDMKEMRVSEAYLILAEASARENLLVDAAGAIKDIRDNRLVNSPALTYGTQAEALTDILFERRIELAFEGHRYKDLKRFNEGYTRDAADCGIGGAPCALEAGNFKFTLPIPVGEIQTNTSINENNPGY